MQFFLDSDKAGSTRPEVQGRKYKAGSTRPEVQGRKYKAGSTRPEVQDKSCRSPEKYKINRVAHLSSRERVEMVFVR